MQNPSSEMFYKLIRRSQSKTESNSACIQVQDSKCFDPLQQRQFFAHYYEDLATPKDLNYDSVFLELCNIRCAETESEYNSSLEHGIQVSETDVGTAF